MKRLFTLLALAATVAACNDDGSETSKWATTYDLGPYTIGELTYNDYTNESAVVAGAGYVNYVCVTSDSDYGTSYGQMFRGIFGVLLPQLLQSVTLEADGNITASYNPGSTIQFDPMWAFAAPEADVVAGLIPKSGWEASPRNLAAYTDLGNKLLVKLNISSIIAQAMGGSADEELAGMIEAALDSSPAALKQLLATVLKTDINISDETVGVLLGWVKNGIPLNVKEQDGHTYFYLDKSQFDTLFKEREDTGTADIMAVWKLLTDMKVLPEEAAMAGALIQGICDTWSECEAFDLGLDLVRR